MKTPLKLWVAGARPRTLPAAVVPVVVGTRGRVCGEPAIHHGHCDPARQWQPGLARAYQSFSVVNALLALVVALALQIGTNYVNDYADGVRGTDEVRVGPVRLVAGKLASVRQVKVAALTAFGVSGIAGLVLAIRVSYWFIPIGLLCGLAGWAYTGGRHPYGYLGTGGSCSSSSSSGWWPRRDRPTCSTCNPRHGYAFPWAFAIWASVPVGLLATALLQANNLRDVETDKETGKKTVAVRLGRTRAGYLYVATLVATAASICVLQHYRGWALIALAAFPLAVLPARLALSDQNGRALLPMLATTARLQLAVGALLTVGLLLVRP